MFRNWLCSVSRVGPPQRDSAPSRSCLRGPGVPSRQSIHFGFVLSSWQGGQCRPPFSARSVFLRLKKPKNRKHAYGFARRNPLFSTARQTKRESILTVRSVPRKNTAFAQSGTLPAFRAILNRLEPGASRGGLLLAQIQANARRQRYPIETQGAYTKPTRIIDPRDPPCDASCKKGPPDASQNLRPPPQPMEKKELIAS
jgi:hypothetical protein